MATGITADITRYAGDTWPTKTIIKVNGVPIELSGWDVNLRYRNKDGEIRIVDCVILSAKDGKVAIYPHDRAETDPEKPERITDQMQRENPELVSNQCWTKDEAGNEYEYSIIRKKVFNGYEEVMTHAAGGLIKILDRV